MITIINYGIGNVASIANMFKRIGQKTSIALDAGDVEKAEKLILPGVGSYDAAVKELQDRNLWSSINNRVLGDKIPILGICLGMQLLCSSSDEGREPGFGWIEARCHKFRFEPGTDIKVPCMGWNHIDLKNDEPIFEDLDHPKFYFVHSYHVVCEDDRNCIATADYGYAYPAAIRKDNIYGVQFHPEKSHRYGMQLLKNFSGI